MGGSGAGLGTGGGGSASRVIDRASFTNEGFGTWSLDTQYGGGQILEASAPGEGKYYEVRVWDSTYERVGSMRVAPTLNSAKNLVKEELKKVNR